MEQSNMIYAKNGQIDTTYLLVISPSSVYKVTIKTINKTEDNKGKTTVNSVSVMDERYPGQLHTISGESPLLEFDEEFYNKSKSLRKETDKTVVKKEEKVNLPNQKLKETKPVARTKNPRSIIIDKYLKEVPEGSKPVFSEIADKVLVELETKEEDKASLKTKIINQARIRFYNLSKKSQ